MSARMITKAAPLTVESFKPFGDVVMHEGEAFRRHLDDAVSMTEPAARPTMWVNRILRPASAPVVRIDQMERHPHSFQALIPLHAARFLVVVAPSLPDGGVDLDGLRPFVTRPGQGVVYRPNIWHFGFTALDGPNEVVVLIGVTGRDDDCIVTKINTQVEVEWNVAAH